MPPLPNTPTWPGAQFTKSTETNLPLTLNLPGVVLKETTSPLLRNSNFVYIVKVSGCRTSEKCT